MDSQVVLWCSRKPSASLKPFVANHVSLIQEFSNVDSWLYVPVDKNLADIVSRRASIRELLDSSLWFSGPGWTTFEYSKLAWAECWVWIEHMWSWKWIEEKCSSVDMYKGGVRCFQYEPQTLLYIKRQKFWHVNGSRCCTKVFSHCVKCFRTRPRDIQQLMGNLPENCFALHLH